MNKLIILIIGMILLSFNVYAIENPAYSTNPYDYELYANFVDSDRFFKGHISQVRGIDTPWGCNFNTPYYFNITNNKLQIQDPGSLGDKCYINFTLPASGTYTCETTFVMNNSHGIETLQWRMMGGYNDGGVLDFFYSIIADYFKYYTTAYNFFQPLILYTPGRVTYNFTYNTGTDVILNASVYNATTNLLKASLASSLGSIDQFFGLSFAISDYGVDTYVEEVVCYNGTTRPEAIVKDTTPPYWIPNSNKTNFTAIATNENGQFNITFTDANSNLDTVIFSRNENNAGWVNEATISNIGTPTYTASFNYTITSTRGETFEWKFNGSDTSGNSNETPTWSLIVANAEPIVNLVSPEDISYERNNFFYHYQVSDADGIEDVDYCELWKDEGSGFFLYNTSSQINIDNYVLEVVEDDDVRDVNWYVNCSDSLNAIGYSGISTVHIDSKYPIPHFIYPKNDNSTIQSYSSNIFFLNVSVENDHLRYVNLVINNPNNYQVHNNYSNELSDEQGVEHYKMDYLIDSSDKSNWLSGVYIVYVNATDWAGNFREWTRTFNISYPPIVESIDIIPETAYTDDILNCTFVVSDIEEIAIKANVTWYKDSVYFKEETEINCVNGILCYTLDPIVPANTNKNEEWNCSIVAYDSYDPSSFKSAIRTIQNTKPEVIGAFVYSTSVYNGADGNLTANYTFYDIDNDAEVNYETRWYKDNSYLSEFDNLKIINNSNIAKGETWFYLIRVFDGDDWSDWFNSSSITIENTPPSVTAFLNSSFGLNYTNENLTCYAQSYDIDNDDVTNIYNWYKNNQPLTVLNMPFESNANDYSSYNNGTIHGTTWESSKIEGIVGNALSFDGVDDYISLSNNPLFDGDSFSASLWVKYTDTDVFSPISASYSTGNYGFHIYTQLGVIRFRVCDSTGCDTSQASGLEDGNWHFITATYNSDIGEMKLYSDGELKDTDTTSIIVDFYQNPVIGRLYTNYNGYYFNGTVDEVKMYSYALTKEQIRQDYLDTKEGFTNSRTIVSQETERYDNYICSITPNDGIVDGIAKNSSLTIKNYPPNAVSLLNPKNNVVLGALPEFNWTESFDIVDYDDINYTLEISTDINFAHLNYTKTLTETKDENVFLTSNEINKYYWRVLATDNIDNSSWSDVRTFNYSQWNITFNVTGSKQSKPELNNVNISICTYSGFSQAGDTTNPYGPYILPNGTWQCAFKLQNYYNKIQTFTADSDKIINVILSEIGGITYEEHTWLEALYNCIILKDCDLYNLLVQINTTTSNIWQHTKPIDASVVTTENLISNTANSTHNVTYEYTIKIPNKAGYAVNTYLPVRIGYWFINKDTGKCYSQGNPPSGIELIEPYCQPLMTENIGPMGGSISFRVDLRPSNLTAGTYNITRSVEIDPNNVWNNYGQETIGEITVTEDLPMNSGGISTKMTSVNEVKTTEVIIQQSSSGGGGGGGSSSPSVTNVYNIYNIEESKEKDTGKESGEKETESKEKGLASITGMAGTDLSKASPLIGTIIMIIIVLGGISSYMLIKRRK